MATIRQRHFSVPSSDSPPIPEWSNMFWYVLRVSALQASEKLTAEQVDHLIASFRSYQVTLPCPDCRNHYAQYWAEHPFTSEQAGSPVKAMAWVEDLRAAIEKSSKSSSASTASAAEQSASAKELKPAVVAALAAIAAPPPKAPAPQTAQLSAAVVHKGVVLRGGVPRASAVQNALSQQRMADAARTKPGQGDQMRQRLAIQSSLQQTAANRAGPRGCNCGRRK